MTAPTAAQLSHMRLRPHRSKVWLSIFEPVTVLSAQINMPAIAKSDRTITVSVLSGAMADVIGGMTCYIGTTAGGKDKGRIRVRSGSGTDLVLAENSINWIDGWYLTVVKFFEPWAVYPRIEIQNNIPIFYKDYDIVYANQNYVLDPIVCMGPNHAAYLDPASGSVLVWYTSSGSMDLTPDGTITGTAWYFGDAGVWPTGTDTRDPGWVNYTGAGHYTTSFTAWTEDGASFTGYRHVSIYNKGYAGPIMPILQWGLESLEGSRDDGGWEARIWIREPASFSRVNDGALVVLFTEDWEGVDYGKVGGNAENRASILFNGYIDDGSIMMDPVTNRLEFTVKGMAATMERLANFSLALESKTNPLYWTELREMTVDRAAAHYLRWHSTVLAVADFSVCGDTKDVQWSDMDRGAMYSAIDGWYQNTLGAKLTVDRQGKLWAETDANLRATGTRGLTTALDMTRQDWMGEISIEMLPHTPISYVEAGGVAYDGPVTGSTAAFLSGAPGVAPYYFGSVEKVTGLVVATQDDCNRFAGMLLARQNAEFPTVDLKLAGDYRIIDIAPQERLTLTMSAQENWRGKVWTNKPFLTQEMAYEFNPEEQVLRPSLTLREETHGLPGDTIIIPVEPPYQDYDMPDWDINFPPLMPLPPIFPPIVPPPQIGSTVYGLCENDLSGVTRRPRLLRTDDFWNFTGIAAAPTWAEISVTGSLENAACETPEMFRLDPRDPKNLAYLLTYWSSGTSHLNGPRLYHTWNLRAVTPTWTQILSNDTVEWMNGHSGTNNQKEAVFLYVDPHAPERIYINLNRAALVAPVMMYSEDFGTTWQHTDLPGYLASSNTDKNTIAGGGAEIYDTATNQRWVSHDKGITLTRVSGTVGWSNMIAQSNGGPKAAAFVKVTTPPVIRNGWYYTSDYWVNWVFWSPFYAGTEWYRGDAPSINGYEAIRCITDDAGGVHAIMNASTGTVRRAYFYAASIGDFWTGRALWTTGTLQPENLSVHPLDKTRLAAWSPRWHGPVTSAGFLGGVIGSSDSGWSWREHNGNIYSVLGGMTADDWREHGIAWDLTFDWTS